MVLHYKPFISGRTVRLLTVICTRHSDVNSAFRDLGIGTSSKTQNPRKILMSADRRASSQTSACQLANGMGHCEKSHDLSGFSATKMIKKIP